MVGTSERRTTPRSYTDATLELRDLDPDAETYVVSLSGPSVGEPAPVSGLLAYSEIQEALLELEDGGIEEEDDLITLGKALANRLLPEGEVRTKVTEAIRGVGADDGIRLRLLIREPRLAQLPWEYTYLPWSGHEGGSAFLVLDPRVSVVRHEALPLPHASVGSKDPNRLRLVAATANVPGYGELDLGTERRVVERALKDLPADGASIDHEPFLANPSVADLQAALLRRADVFHFAGHGGFEHGAGYLALPAEKGEVADHLGADRLAGLLRQAGVRVAVLGACESGRRDRASPWAGVAPALVADQVAAVVAMQYRVRDSYAIKFARAFYTALAVGLSVDEAVAAGRLAVYDEDDMSRSWGIPVLYLRSPDGVVFPRLCERASGSADAFRTAVRQVVGTIDKGGKVVGIKVVRGAGGAATIEVSQEATVVRDELVGIENLDLTGGRSYRPDDTD